MIYLDNAATTRPCGAAISAMHTMLEENWFNPSAAYGEAVRVEKEIASARKCIAERLGTGLSLIFTGSGTEADALAVLGSAARHKKPRRVLLFAGEHSAVRKTEAQLAAMGHAVSFVPAAPDGRIDLDALDSLLDADVCLLSTMHVNNETGTVQPVAEASRMLKQKAPGAVFHVDGIQAFLRVPVDLRREGIDLYSVSAHKVHGPKGIGALAAQKEVRLHAQIEGGGQEGGLRAGTENTAGIAGFAAAVAWISALDGAQAKLRALKLHVYRRLVDAVGGLRVNGPDPEGAFAAPHILNVSLPGVRGEVMLHALEQEGILVGTGAACSAKKKGMSAAFAAMRAPEWAAESAVRISFGLMNTREEAETAADAILRCWNRYKAYQRR